MDLPWVEKYLENAVSRSGHLGGIVALFIKSAYHSLAFESRVCLKLYTLSWFLTIPDESNQSFALSRCASGLSPLSPLKIGGIFSSSLS